MKVETERVEDAVINGLSKLMEEATPKARKVYKAAKGDEVDKIMAEAVN